MKTSILFLPLIVLFSCTKKEIPLSGNNTPEKRPETVMTLPGYGELLSAQIWLDPADGRYKSSNLDFGTTLTHPVNYITGQAGVGITSITGRNGDLITADFSGDRFTAYLIGYPNTTMPDGPISSVQKVSKFIGYEVDVDSTILLVGNIQWTKIVETTSLYWSFINNRYYSLDSAKLKAKGGKLKIPLTSTDLTGQIFSPNSDGIIIYKGRILMDANSPSGMSIFSYNQQAIDDTPAELGSYYINGDINKYVFFRGNANDALVGYGPILDVFSYELFSQTPTGTFRVEKDNATGKDKFYVTCRGVLQDGTDFILNDQLLSYGIE
ncbi:hypothetical protein LL912_23955 [Niabella sp. CC-SYL272]|uniref:hypothetical protein n=1 Tax=Niabella agricola TaxID=2891571 RepID=UPI001F2ED6F2|nr:hypothetical protein [Niabella agricola]MCF3111864.1 hypothetical protein [Niabella agricola]